jgi:tRNA threonylcarbamoyladenosine biosynthesis protein TsaB
MVSTVLAIDTATELASVALYDTETGARAEYTWYTSMNHTVELMPAVVQILERQRTAPERLDGVAVALGPGSFTGLRIGLSVAKGLCLSLGIPIVGIPTLDIVAYAHYGQNLPICAVLQAGRGRICVAFYEKRETDWRRNNDYHLADVEELNARVKVPTLFCGEIDASLKVALEAQLGERAMVASPASSLRRAAYLAELGWKRLRTSRGDDLPSLEPLYLHHPQIRD